MSSASLRFPSAANRNTRVRLQHSGEKPAAESIDWGHDEAYAWAGRAAVKLGRIDEARAFYQKALEVNPANGWVAKSLLPELEKKAKS